MRRWPILIPLLLLSAGTAFADEPPKWSLEIEGGFLYSAMDQWATYYDDDRLPRFGAALAYKLLRPLEVGIEAGYLRDTGQGFAPIHGTVAGDVKYELFPVQLAMTLRGVFYEDQWLVPYIGAALGRYIYRIRIEGEKRISGATDGTEYRAGLQLLLDRLDRPATRDFRRDFGVNNTYLFLEARKSKAEVNDNDLGGTSYLGGLLFEF